jgi:hypothetical protein
MFRDHAFLISAADQNAKLRIWRCDFRGIGAVQRWVHSNAKKAKPFANPCAESARIFANACREDQSVNPAHGGRK